MKRTRAWFEFKNHLNFVGDNEEQVDLVIGGMQTIYSSLSEKLGTKSTANIAHRVDRFITHPEQVYIVIQNTDVSLKKRMWKLNKQ